MGRDFNKNAIVRKTNTVVKISVSKTTKELVIHEPQFTQIERNYSNKFRKPPYGIIRHFTIEKLVSHLNEMKPVENKADSPCILKGIYEGGTSGEYCVEPMPYLFLDIDVKTTENKNLENNAVNSSVFSFLKEHGVFAYRSYSGRGMSACIYVPILADITALNSRLHLKIGNAITSHLSQMIHDKLGVIVEFDVAQNKFRQARYLATQKSQVKINSNPSQFNVEVTEEEVATNTGVPVFTSTVSGYTEGSIESQYNQNTKVEEILAPYHVSGYRYKLPGTTSSTSGEYDPVNNIFWNHSTSFSPYKYFTPFWLTANLHYNGDRNLFIKDLKDQGYQTIKPKESKVNKAITAINKGGLSNEELYKICSELVLLSDKQKHDFISKLNTEYATLQKVHVYLQVTELKIQYDHVIEIESYVSEAFDRILDYADEHPMTCIKAETGTGKSTAIFNEVLELRPDSRVLVVEPLTAIVDQLAHYHTEAVGLTGTKETSDFDLANESNIVIATLEQAATLLLYSYFDYVFIDEAHGLISSNSYKLKAIRNFTKAMKENDHAKFIALTGTPQALLRNIGFKLVNVVKKKQEPTKVIERHTNVDPYKTLLNHQKHVKGKAVYRLNNVASLEIFKEQLIAEQGYLADEILVIHSSKEVKNGEDYNHLLENEEFMGDVKIVLATSMIDEGINIKQKGFTDVVFIEGSDYFPTPEALKQFLARFRNSDINRNLYFYRKVASNRPYKYINPQDEFETKKEDIENRDATAIYKTSFNDFFNNDNYFYKDKTMNPYYLAYKVHTWTFENISLFEFREYLRVNLNLILLFDEDYLPTKEDVDFKKEKRKKRSEDLNKHWEDNRDQIRRVVHHITLDEDLKKNLNEKLDNTSDFTDLDSILDNTIDEDVEELVNQQPKKCENYLKAEIRLEELSIKPDLFMKSNGKLRGTQSLNNQMKIAENLALYINPINTYDEASSIKLRGFIKEFIQKPEFTIEELKQRLTELNSLADFNDVVYIDLLKCFADLTYDKRNKKYKVKTVYEYEWVLTQFFNYRNKKRELCPNENQVDKQLLLF